jgi:hypothetical protein
MADSLYVGESQRSWELPSWSPTFLSFSGTRAHHGSPSRATRTHVPPQYFWWCVSKSGFFSFFRLTFTGILHPQMRVACVTHLTLRSLMLLCEQYKLYKILDFHGGDALLYWLWPATCSPISTTFLLPSHYWFPMWPTPSLPVLLWLVVFDWRSSLQPPAHAGSSLADFSTLKMEVIRSSETSVHTRTTGLHIPKNGILQYRL